MSSDFPGQFAIRTELKQTFLTAKDGGHHSIDAVTTDGASVGQFEKFIFSSIKPDITTIRTLNGHYVTAAAGGGLGGDFSAAEMLQTESTEPSPSGYFRFSGPRENGTYAIGTLNYHYLTALGGGGKSTGAFHTDAAEINEWERYQILKCGDLGTGYTYAISPAGIPENNQLQFLNVAGGGEASVQAGTIGPFIIYYSPIKFLQLELNKYALQVSDGINYLSAVDGGGIANGVNLHANTNQIFANEIFRIGDLGDGTYTIQTESNYFVAAGPNGAISTRISDPDLAPGIGYSAKFNFIVIGLTKQLP